MSLSKLRCKEFWIPYIASFFGCLLVAVAINAFYVPVQLLSSGVGGMAMIIHFLTGLPLGVLLFLMNVPILIACYLLMGRAYTAVSIAGTIMVSVMVDMTTFLIPMAPIKDPLMASVTGGLLSGIGFGILYKYDGNSGGLDVVGAIIKKFYSFEMGTAVMVINTLIVLMATILFSLQEAMLTFISIYITGVVTNKVVLGTKQRKAVVIISDKAENITDELLHHVGRGVTFLHGEGAYTRTEKQIIYTIIKLTEVPKVKNVVSRIDPQAFMTIMDASEVFGRGFSLPSAS